jgi:uncharacterized protein (TIGR02217 family)
MTHISARLPAEVELGAIRRDNDDIEVVRTDGGHEVRNARASQSLLEFDISYPASLRDGSVYLAVRAAYKAARGRLYSFDFRDFSEYQATNEVFGEGDGVTTAFPLIKSYTFGTETHERRIFRPVSAIALKGDGVVIGSGYSVNYATGVVTFTGAPANGVELSWTGEFNVPARFETPMEISGIATHLDHIENMTLVEVRL